jgi:hypothetical protein
MVDAGLEERAQPMPGIEVPPQDRLQHTKQHRRQAGTPDAAGAIIVLATDHGIAQRPFGGIIVHCHFWTHHKDGEPVLVIVEALPDLALRPVEMALSTIHLTAGRHGTQVIGQGTMLFDKGRGWGARGTVSSHTARRAVLRR